MEECLELIGRVNVVSHTFNVPPSDVEATASRVTDKVLSDGQVSSPAFFLMCLTGWVAWREKNTQDELRNIFSNILRVIKSQKLEDARVCLYPLVLLQYVTDYQVDKEQVIKVLFQEGVPLKKEVKGLTYAVVDSILRRRGSSVPQEEKSPADEATPHHKPNSAEQADTPAMMEDAAPVDGEEEKISDSMQTREEVLAKVGKWYALEPTNEAIHVGLRRLQELPYREIYSKVFGEITGEFTKAMQEKIRRRWRSFLNLADDRGIPKKTLEDMVSPR
jgi:hypothetical protein